jgi:hypothetical protein
MKNSRCVFVLTAFASTQAAFCGDISGTVTLKGTPPPEQENKMIKADPKCGPLLTEPVMTQFYVVGANKGLGDVFIQLTGVKAKSDGATAPPIVLDQVKCQYKPYLFAVQINQKILARNSDPLLHNVRPSPARSDAGNKPSNRAHPQGAPDLTFVFPAPELFLRFACDIHPWMVAYVCVVDHPYFAVTDKDGKYTIKNVPDGKYTMEVYHRKAAPVSSPVKSEVEVRGGSVTKDFVLEAK